MGRLTTHVLDTARGRPAAGMRIDLFRLEDGMEERVATATTNGDGRIDEPLLDGSALIGGVYEIRFAVGAYLQAQADDASFLDVIPVRFTIDEAEAHYHVPLLVSPFGYTTYRGS